MKISIKRIDDGDKSIHVGSSEDDHQLKLRCDYLSVVSETRDKEEKQFIAEQLELMRKSKDDQYRIKIHFSHQGADKIRRYRYTVTIRDNSVNAPVLLWIGFDSFNKDAGDIRFDFRPQHLSKKGLNTLILWLAGKLRFGGLLFTLLARAWVTRVDAALDVYELYLDEVYVSLKGSFKAENRCYPDGGQEVCLGSRSSSLYVACYSKVDSEGKDIPEPDNEGTVSINTAKMALFTRFEARLHNKRKHQLKLGDLQRVANLFEGLELYERSLDADLEMYPEFASLLALWPLPRAKFEFKKIVGKNEFQKFERHCLNKHKKATFLDTPALWEHWYLCVYELGLLGQPAYWMEVHRERRIARGLNLLTV